MIRVKEEEIKEAEGEIGEINKERGGEDQKKCIMLQKTILIEHYYRYMYIVEKSFMKLSRAYNCMGDTIK